jgi:hypothetical protein
MYSSIFLDAMTDELNKLAADSYEPTDEEMGEGEYANDPNLLTSPLTLAGGGSGSLSMAGFLQKKLPNKMSRGKMLASLAAIMGSGVLGSLAGGEVAKRIGNVAPRATNVVGGTLQGGLTGTALAALASALSKGKIPPSAVGAGAAIGSGLGALRGATIE